jgi:hypothetical protein
VSAVPTRRRSAGGVGLVAAGFGAALKTVGVCCVDVVSGALAGGEAGCFAAGFFFFFTGGAESGRAVVSGLSSIFADSVAAFRMIATNTSASDGSIGTVNADAGSSENASEYADSPAVIVRVNAMVVFVPYSVTSAR